jgi:hypothetical protein
VTFWSKLPDATACGANKSGLASLAVCASFALGLSTAAHAQTTDALLASGVSPQTTQIPRVTFAARSAKSGDSMSFGFEAGVASIESASAPGRIFVLRPNGTTTHLHDLKNTKVTAVTIAGSGEYRFGEDRVPSWLGSGARIGVSLSTANGDMSRQSTHPGNFSSDNFRVNNGGVVDGTNSTLQNNTSISFHSTQRVQRNELELRLATDYRIFESIALSPFLAPMWRWGLNTSKIQETVNAAAGGDSYRVESRFMNSGFGGRAGLNVAWQATSGLVLVVGGWGGLLANHADLTGFSCSGFNGGGCEGTTRKVFVSQNKVQEMFGVNFGANVAVGESMALGLDASWARERGAAGYRLPTLTGSTDKMTITNSSIDAVALKGRFSVGF